MKLHVFNPEHDLALASGLANFTAPHAGRQLRHDLGWLPALWAGEDDAVLVDNVRAAMLATSRRRARTRLFVESRQLASLPITGIEPWGWDAALCAQLLRSGVSSQLLPTGEELQAIRLLSHRRTAAQLLSRLQTEGTVGEAFECAGYDEAMELVRRLGKAVLKAPWSSSGRGVRFVDATMVTDNTGNWLQNLLKSQGAVMVEPYYRKVKDFGMEFVSDGKGTVSCLGLSLFHTENGAYTGNILATEQAKREIISRYLPLALVESTQAAICRLMGPLLKDSYQGPFGIDMMVVGRPSPPTLPLPPTTFHLHPCVEINLRRTMGHVALALTPSDDDVRRTMRIDYAHNNYKLLLRRL